MRLSSTIRFLLTLLCLWVQSGPAFAYVDPGSGFMMLQGLLAVIGGLIIFVRQPMATLKRLWSRLTRRRDDHA